ncbi:MAG: protein-disulfide reductase DsbD domain-containing protein [Pseudobacter sp.]|uniref:protein-disulfide reductase DsbD domain-containing protein n=1 Tax=Pseudobacter sp. TaxID=2045420 RepID=UPI003F81C78E
MKKWILFALLYCAVATVMAQDAISYKAVVERKGDTILVKLLFDIAPGMHVYAPSLLNETQGYSGMKLIIDSLPAGLKDLKEPNWSESSMEGGGEVYRGDGHAVVFRLLGKPKQGPARIKGILVYQACNEEMCFPPDEKMFSVELKKGK